MALSTVAAPKRGRKPLCRCGEEEWTMVGKGPRSYIACASCGGVPGVSRKDAAQKRILDNIRLASKVAALAESLGTTPRTESTDMEAEVSDDKVMMEALAESLDSYDEEQPGWTPGSGDFITLKGKPYLPARRRIQWMRGGEPKPHPEWGIETEIIQFERGERLGVGRVKGGYACVRAYIVDMSGDFRKVIATGMKTEWSENFADFLEKAETGAIARALAVAGYGTETALDLDEGAEQGRPADAPVDVAPPKPIELPPTSRPIIAASTAPSVAHGGRQHAPNAIQMDEVFRLAKDAHMSLRGLVTTASNTLHVPAPDLPEDAEVARIIIGDWFQAMTADELGRVITQLSSSIHPKLSEDVEDYEAL